MILRDVSLILYNFSGSRPSAALWSSTLTRNWNPSAQSDTKVRAILSLNFLSLSRIS